ncbi:hypothetical protein CPLU01_08531 [Colletotrichum plurivorum]|uniref:Uncharacterized protein n=1 Tax=Colletotrichum plurivorum TaxID=2175906 RepID=A0A8H6KBW2_9PEZI|nr:hypothetical protein CPLU01_08531 [Colletotrichum plurivorum]
MERRPETHTDSILALYRLYFGDEIFEYFSSHLNVPDMQKYGMTHMFIAIAQPLYLLREEVAMRIKLRRLGRQQGLRIERIRASLRTLRRLADGSSIQSLWRSYRRFSRDTHRRQLARAQLFLGVFPDRDWQRGLSDDPLLYFCIQKHISNLINRAPTMTRIIDDQLRWNFRADYIVANIPRLRRGGRHSCLAFSLEDWKHAGRSGLRLARLLKFHVLLPLIFDAQLFPSTVVRFDAHCPFVDDMPPWPRHYRASRRAGEYLATRIIDAAIPLGEWTETLVEMKALVDRLGDSHRDRRVCEARELL